MKGMLEKHNMRKGEEDFFFLMRKILNYLNKFVKYTFQINKRK